MSTNTSLNERIDSRVQSKWSQMEQRAIQLLGSGLNSITVATAVGVSDARIAQLLGMEDFAAEVTALRFQNLQKHNVIDNEYDEIEGKLLSSLKEQLPMIMRPSDILRALQVVNNAKRRGQAAPENIQQQNTVVNLLMPVAITQQFTTNVNNQVIVAAGQTLETMQSSSLLAAAKQKAESLHNELPGYKAVAEISGPSGS